MHARIIRTSGPGVLLAGPRWQARLSLGETGRTIHRTAFVVCGGGSAIEVLAGSARGPFVTLNDAVTRFVALADGELGDFEEAFHTVVSQMHGLCAEIRRAELEGETRDAILSAVRAARAVHSRSPFVRRLQDWPRGMPGDFETIEYLCDGRNLAPVDSVGYLIERYALTTGLAQQHRNKIQWQGAQVLEAVRWQRARLRVLSIACGGSRDLLAIRSVIPRDSVAFVLNDADPEALELSRNRLQDWGGCIESLPGDVFHALRPLRHAPPFDMIVAGGLFDYLEDRAAAWLLTQLAGLLAPAGRICFTNIAAGNPYRVWMEYLVDWRLVGRSIEDVQNLVSKASPAEPLQMTIESDTTALAHLISVTRQ